MLTHLLYCYIIQTEKEGEDNMGLSEKAKKKQLEYIKNFTKDSYKKFTVYVSIEKEQDIIEQLAKQEKASGYIKELIRQDILRKGK